MKGGEEGGWCHAKGSEGQGLGLKAHEGGVAVDVERPEGERKEWCGKKAFSAHEELQSPLEREMRVV